MVARSHADAELVEHLSDVVGVDARHVQAHDTASISRIGWTDNPHATIELQGQAGERVAGQIPFVRDNIVHAESLEVLHGGVEADRFCDRWRAGLESRGTVGGGVAVDANVGNHAAAAEKGGHDCEQFRASP